MAKRQFLQNWSSQFPNKLQCSSIRMNAEQVQHLNTKKSQYQLNSPTTPAFVQHQRNFSSNDFVCFQNSIQMGGQYANQMELVKSKSIDRNRDSKDNQAQLTKSKFMQANSLYNTNSFDQMTMKISTNTRNNTSNYINQSQLTPQDQFYQKTLKKRQLVPFDDFYSGQKMIIKLSTQNKNIKQSASQLRITYDNKNILQNMKSSIDSLKDSRRLKHIKEESFYEEPYFNNSNSPPFANNNQVYSFKQYQTTNRRQSNFFKKAQQPIIKTLRSIKSQTKLTLRDYIYLSKLSNAKGKSRLKSDINSQSKITLNSEHSPRRKKKQLLSNAEVMNQIKFQLCQQIKKVQVTMKDAFDFVNSLDDENEQKIIKLFSLNRLFQDNLLKATQQIQTFISQNQ